MELSGWLIAGKSDVLIVFNSVLSQLSHLSYEDRVAEVRCNTVSIVQLLQLPPTGGQPSKWTFLHHNTALMLPPPYYYTSMSPILYKKKEEFNCLSILLSCDIHLHRMFKCNYYNSIKNPIYENSIFYFWSRRVTIYIYIYIYISYFFILEQTSEYNIYKNHSNVGKLKSILDDRRHRRINYVVWVFKWAWGKGEIAILS